MKASQIKINLFVFAFLTCLSVQAQTRIKILTPGENVISYTIKIGSRIFKCNNQGAVILTAKQFSLLKNKPVSFDITDKLNKDFYDQITLCTTIECSYDSDSKGGIMMIGLTLEKLTSYKNDTFYFHLNKFGQMNGPTDTKTG